MQAKSTFIRLNIFQAPSDCPRGLHLYPIASENRSGGMSALLQPFSLVECLLMAGNSPLRSKHAPDAHAKKLRSMAGVFYFGQE
jgi:hypothetical protein